MIKYSLNCADCENQFEAWFRSSEDYDHQEGQNLIECPICESKSVTKAIMAPRVHTSKKQESVKKELAELKKYVRQNFEDVGERFTEEAISMWHGDSEMRDIHGTVTPEDHERLKDEGVPYTPLPWGTKEDA